MGRLSYNGAKSKLESFLKVTVVRSEKMRIKIQNLLLIFLAPFCFYASNSLALDKVDIGSTRICVFDIDETLVFRTENGVYVQAPEAQAVIDLCLAKNYKIAIATAYRKYRSPELLADLKFGDYDFSINNAVDKNYTHVRKVNPAVNPIYIYQTNGKYMSPESTLANKAQALDRIMRTYFGMGVGGSFVDKNNSYLSQYLDSHNNALPSDKDLTGCLVLFDDNPKNISDINVYNQIYDVKFGAVKVEYDQDKKIGTGVTLKNAKEAFALMDASCKS